VAETKLNNRERIKEIVAGIESGIRELFQSEKYFDYLRIMSRFHSYSVNNTILIYMQRPGAELPIAGFQKWKQLGRHVKKGEKGITIIAPTPYKKKIEEMKLDPDTKVPLLDADGNAIIEEKTIEIPLFKPVKVFSADQTDGKPLPTLAADLTGDVRHYEAFMEALRRTSPVPISIQPIPENMDGFFSQADQSITIREGMSEVQTVCAAVHEITHAKLHNGEKDRLAAAAEGKEPPRPKDKNTIEIEAEGCAFSVLAYYGIDSSANSIGYITSWSSGRDLKELKASLETITKTVHELVSDIDRHFAEICKERGIDLTAQPEKEPDTPEKYVADFFDHLYGLHDKGLIPDPFSTVKREEAESMFLAFMRDGNFDSFRSVLKDAEEQTNVPAADLGERLEALSDRWDAALIYKVEPLLSPETAVQHSMVHAYKRQDENLISGEVVFTGSMAECLRVVAALDAGTLTRRQMRQPDFELPPVSELSEPEAVSNSVTTLDEYPMPDGSVTMEDLERKGYKYGDLLPLSRNRAAALLEQDVTIYMVKEGSGPEMVFDNDDLMEQSNDTLFAVSREEWEVSQNFRQAVMDRMNHQEEREQAFLDHNGDCFAIYQLKDGDEMRNLRYEPLPGQGVDKKFYELAYTAPLPDGATLDTLWEKFNVDHPRDYCRPSMSVSDIVALKQADEVSCHYVDRYSFTRIQGFLPQDDLLQSSKREMTDTANQERGAKKSVLQKLRNKQPVQDKNRAAPKKSAERER